MTEANNQDLPIAEKLRQAEQSQAEKNEQARILQDARKIVEQSGLGLTAATETDQTVQAALHIVSPKK